MPKVRASTIVTGFAVAVATISLLQVHRTTCRFAPSPGELSDVGSIRTVLREWAIRDPSVSKAVTQINQLIEINQTAPTLSLAALAVAGLQCGVMWNIESWGDPLVWGDQHRTPRQGAAHLLLGHRGAWDVCKTGARRRHVGAHRTSPLSCVSTGPSIAMGNPRDLTHHPHKPN